MMIRFPPINKKSHRNLDGLLIIKISNPKSEILNPTSVVLLSLLSLLPLILERLRMHHQ